MSILFVHSLWGKDREEQVKREESMFPKFEAAREKLRGDKIGMEVASTLAESFANEGIEFEDLLESFRAERARSVAVKANEEEMEYKRQVFNINSARIRFLVPITSTLWR